MVAVIDYMTLPEILGVGGTGNMRDQMVMGKIIKNDWK